MKIIVIGAVAVALGGLSMAPDAHAGPDKGHKHGAAAKHTPPGLAKKPYGMPPGQAKKMGLYERGQHLPRTYYTDRTYYIDRDDYPRLRVAPAGYEWVRVGNDVYLAQTRTGLIMDVVRSLF